DRLHGYTCPGHRFLLRHRPGHGPAAHLLWCHRGGPGPFRPTRGRTCRGVVGHFAVHGDVADDASVRTAVALATTHLGGLDVLVNNAGIGARGTVADNDDTEWHRVLDINVLGAVRTVRATLPHLREAGRTGEAAIVNTCSIAATAGLPERALYSASKGALASLTLALAADPLAEGIRVNCVHPGTVDTPWVGRLLATAEDPDAERAALEARQPTGRLVTPDEVAHAIAH